MTLTLILLPSRKGKKCSGNLKWLNKMEHLTYWIFHVAFIDQSVLQRIGRTDCLILPNRNTRVFTAIVKYSLSEFLSITIPGEDYKSGLYEDYGRIC